MIALALALESKVIESLFKASSRRPRGSGKRNVTFPALSCVVNGGRRAFALLRPIVDTTSPEKVRQLVLDAYAEFEERAAVAQR